MSSASGNTNSAIGHVTEAAGPVIVVNQDGEQRLLETGDAVYFNELIITQAGASASIRLTDNRVVALSEQSSLLLDDSLRVKPVIETEQTQTDSPEAVNNEKTIAEIIQGADPVDVSPASSAGNDSQSSESDGDSESDTELESEGFSSTPEMLQAEGEAEDGVSIDEEAFESSILEMPGEEEDQTSFAVSSNYIPVAQSSRMFGSEDGNILEGQLSAMDGSSGNLSYHLVSAPPKGLLTLSENGFFKFEPGLDFQSLAEGDQASVSFTFEIRDAQGNFSQSSVDIKITGVNDAPEVTQTVESTADPNGGPLSVNLLEHASDVDRGDSLYVSRIQLQSGNEAGVSLSLNGNELVVDPQAYRYLAEGEQETLTYEYRVSDGQGAYVIQTAEIVISGENDLPTVSRAVAYQGDQNAGSLSVDLLEGASDIDLSDTLNIVFLQLEAGDPQGVSFNAQANTLEVDSAAYAELSEGETESIEYSYQIDDGHSGQVEQTATLEIEGVNDAPTCLDNQATINEDEPYTFALADFPYSDIDNNDQLAYVQISTLPSEGLIFLNGQPILAGQDINRADIDNGLLIFTPEDNASGDNYSSFRFRVSDGDLLSGEQTFSFDVTPVADEPGLSIAGSEVITELDFESGLGDWTSENVDENTPYIFTVSDFAFADVDTGDEFKGIQITQLPAAGTLLFNGSAATAGQNISKIDLLTGRLKFEPALNENGDQYASFEFKVSDGELLSEAASFEINVTPVNDAPFVSADISENASEDISLILTEAELLANASDIDGDTLSVNNLSVSNGQVSVAVNDAAIIAGDDTDTDSDSDSVAEDAASTLTASGTLTISDVDTGESSFIAETITGNYGDLTIAADGSWTYQADNSQADIQSLPNDDIATESLAVRSLDGTVHNVVITITGVNDAAQITGATTASITENVAVNAGDQLLASGLLQVTDIDSGEAFFNPGIISGSYGSLNLGSSGNWVYTADNSQTAIQSLGAGDQLVETLTVTTLDGSSQDITISINGSNDAAVISGINAGNVTEDASAELVSVVGQT